MNVNLSGQLVTVTIRDFSGALAAGTAQALAPLNNARKVFVFQNNGSNPMWISPGGTAAVNGTGANVSLQVLANGVIQQGDSVAVWTEATTVIGTMGDNYTCYEAA